jgi:acetoin utilization deacetylase AcuC-like enzyme
VIPAVWSPLHRRHAPTVEVEFGQPVAQYELPARADEIHRALAEASDHFRLLEPVSHGVGPIEAVHDPGLVAFLGTAWEHVHRKEGLAEAIPDTVVHPALRAGMGPAPAPAGAAARLGYWCFETMTPLVEGTYDAARGAVDVALTAMDLVLGGEPVAYGLCRPPGHHAPTAAYGGYCYFNNASITGHAIAASTGTKVSVLDVDYHHGNGTQQIFYERGDVQYVSLHGDPNRAYPYFAGYAEETGARRGAGANLNLPLPPGTDDDDFLAALVRAIDAIDTFDPAVVVVSLGVDTFHLDPIADFELSTDAFTRSGEAVAGLARPLVVLQEGGYHLPSIGGNVRAWLDGVATGLTNPT